VKSGETLGGIAKKYHTSSDALMRANGLKRPLIFPGQSLVVSGKPSKAKPAIAKTVVAKSNASKARVVATAAKVHATQSKSVKPTAKPVAKKVAGKSGAKAKKVVAKKTN